MAGYSTHVDASFRRCAIWQLWWILDESLARLVAGADDDCARVRHVPSWRRRRGSIRHPIEFDL
jgi:hypothetical protein